MTGGAPRGTELITGPSGPLELLVTGAGDPVTVFAPGLGESITTTRPFGSGVAGTKAFFHFSGYGGARVDHAAGGPEGPAGGAGWRHLGAQLLAVADHVGATRAVGASLGAVAILTALTTPGADSARFDRVVLLLPPAVDGTRLAAIAQLLDRGDTAGLRGMLRADRTDGEPRDHRRRAPWRDAVDRVAALGPVLLADLAETPPLTPERLATVRVPVLVVAQEADPAHPVAAANRWIELLPNATAVTLPGGGLLTAHRAAVRDAVAGFLGRTSQFPGSGCA